MLRINNEVQSERVAFSRSAGPLVSDSGGHDAQTYGSNSAAIALCITMFAANDVSARDPDGRYANSPLKQWFDQLASGKGLCCSFADGFSVQDVDWDTQDGSYRVRLQGEWVVVPDEALVTEPNRFGPAVVWPYLDASGATQIRCFLPGTGV